MLYVGMSKPENLIRATGTSFRIIEALRDLEAAGTTDVADHLDIPKSTAHNHLLTLVEQGYVVRDEDTFELSLRFLELGEYVRTENELYQIARPIIDELAEETGEVANLVVPEEGQGVYLYKAMGNRAVHHDTRPGKRIDLHCTALGKSILSALPRADVEAIIDEHGLEAKTSETITDPEALFEELESIRERGFAINHGERNERVRCVAAPVVIDGRPLGAISVSGPRTRMQGDRLESEVPERVLEASNVIEINVEHN